jgi:glycosidase
MRWLWPWVIFVASCGPKSGSSHDLGVDLALSSQDLASAEDLAMEEAADLAGSDLAGSDLLGLPAIDWRHQVIYLALVDRFFNGSTANDNLGLPGCFDPTNPQLFHGGDYVGMTQKLPYLTELGASALWVTPAYQQATGPTGRCGYHGYWADYTEPDDGAIEPRFGTAAELSQLIQALHSNGTRFILDMVVNHAGDGARIATQHPDWFHDPATCNSLGDPAIYCPYRAGIHDFAQEIPAVADYLDNASAGWAQRFQLDGIRMDTAKYVLPSYFHDHWVPAMRAARPLFLVAEVFSENAADLKPYLDAGFDSTFNFPLRRALINSFALGGSVDAIASVIADEQTRYGDRALYLVNLLDNHDTGRFASEPGALADDELQKRFRLGLIALFTLPGIPQIYTGDELGILGGNDPDNRRDMPSWAWTAADRAGAHTGAMSDAAGTFSLVQRLIAARAKNVALSEGSYKELWTQNGGANNLYVFLRSSNDARVIAAFNNGTAVAAQEVKLTELADGTVVDDQALAGAPRSLVAAQNLLRLSLPAKTGALYRPRDPSTGSAVTFTVQAPAGMPIALVGSTPELGEWDPARAIEMSFANGSWSVTVHVLPFNQAIAFKFLRLPAGWEGGTNRTFTVPSAPTASYNGGTLN